MCLYALLRYILNDDRDGKLEGSIRLQILFYILIIRLKYDKLYVEVLHNGVSKYLLLNVLLVSVHDPRSEQNLGCSCQCIRP